MLTKNQTKFIQSLQLPKVRKENLLFVAEGTKMVGEILQSKFYVENVIVTNEWLDKNQNFNFYGKQYEIANGLQMKQMSSLSTPPGILAVAKIPQYDLLPDMAQKELILMLDGIHDPGNLGTIIRTADWFGIRKIVCSTDTVDCWSPKVVQSTMGSVFRVEIVETELVDFLKSAQQKGISIYGAMLDGEDVFEKKFEKEKGILIIGSESHGIRENIIPFVLSPIHILKHANSKAESLNASVATAVILAEFFRKSIK